MYQPPTSCDVNFGDSRYISVVLISKNNGPLVINCGVKYLCKTQNQIGKLGWIGMNSNTYVEHNLTRVNNAMPCPKQHCKVDIRRTYTQVSRFGVTSTETCKLWHSLWWFSAKRSDRYHLEHGAHLIESRCTLFHDTNVLLAASSPSPRGRLPRGVLNPSPRRMGPSTTTTTTATTANTVTAPKCSW